MTNKTKIKAIIAATLFAVVTIVGYFNKKESPRDLTLSDLAVTSDANAECIKQEAPLEFMNTGRCFELTGTCHWMNEVLDNECDPYAFQY